MNKIKPTIYANHPVLITFVFFLTFCLTSTAFAISIKKVELSGTTLSIEGSDAGNNAAILIDGQAGGNADDGGKYRFDMSGYSSLTCIVQVSDGVTSTSRAISNCNPATSPPPPPQNSAPVANAGTNITVQDADLNGVEMVTLNGAASSDPDGSVVNWLWAENGLQIASGASAVLSFSLGTHSVELTVTDNQGATAVDTIIVSVVSPSTPPPPPPSLPPLVADAILESNQMHSGSFDPALMGWSVDSAGDVNGDGFEDVIVGARGWDTAGGLFDEGAVFVFLGSANGIVGFNPATAHAIIQSTEANAEFGSSVAGAGDVNRDGFDDIIVGAPLASPSGLGVSGAAYIFHGGPLGIIATSPADANAVLESKQLEGHLGRSVASAGDVNGDGYADVIVGATLYGEAFDPPIPNQGSGRQGAAFVFLGSATGIVGNQPSNAHAQLVPWAAGTPQQVNSKFGASVAGVGDVNGDGYGDILIGSPAWNQSRPWPGLGTGNPPEEGAVFLYHGSPSGITGTNATNANTRIEGNQLGAFFGNSVSAAGDVNRDGFADIIIGAVGYPAGDPLLGAQNGAAFVYLGGSAGIVATDPSQAHVSFQGAATAEWLGRSVSGVGDYDGDGFDDVIISARNYPGSLNNEGVSYIFRGGLNGIVGTGLADAYARITSNRENANLGFSARGAGDIDADGRADIIVGVTGYSNGESKEGAAFVYLGAPSLLPPNQVAVANAGVDVTLVDNDNNGVELATLDGSASFDVDGSIVSYEWREGATLLGLTATIQASLAIGDHLITLTVFDNSGDSSSDQVLVRVITGAANLRPVANAGPDQAVTDDNADGFATVTLDASASADTDGTIVRYIWQEGTTILGTGAVLNVTLAVGVHNILLQVNDNSGSGAQDVVVATVNQGSVQPPSDPQGAISLMASAVVQRGDDVTFTVTLTNMGSTAITQTQLALSVSPGNLVKSMQPGGIIAVADIPAGGSVTRSWSGSANKEGTGSITVEAVSNGVSVDTMATSLTVLK